MGTGGLETLTNLVDRVVPEESQFTPEKFKELEDALQGAVARSCEAAGLDADIRDQRISSLKALLDPRRPEITHEICDEPGAVNAPDEEMLAPAIHHDAEPEIIFGSARDTVSPTINTGPHRSGFFHSDGGKRGALWLAFSAIVVGLAGAGSYLYFDEMASTVTAAFAQQPVKQNPPQLQSEEATAAVSPTPALTAAERALLEKRFSTISTIQQTLKTHAGRVNRYPATGGKFVAAPRLLKTLKTQGTALPNLDLKVAQALRYKSDGKSFKLAYLATGDCYKVMKVAPERVDPKRRFGGDCYSYGRWTPGGKDF